MMPRNKAPSVLCVLLASLVLQGAAENALLEDHPDYIYCLAKQDPADPNDTCTSLDLGSWDVTGSIPTTVGELTKLTKFHVYGNAITDAIPTEVGLLTEMQSFHVYGNDITSSIPTEVGLLTEMQSFYVYGNAITGAIPTEVGLMTETEEFWVAKNAITGAIPTEVGLLTEMQGFWVSDNAITSSIPTEVGMMTKMTEGFWVDLNSITSSIPTEVGMMMGMKEFWISVNAITGPIPTELGQLTSTLDQLRLDGNALTGPIPTEIGQLTWLIDLAVAENSLSGSLPTELAVLASGDSCDPDPATPATSHCLYTLFVHHNEDLCGPLIPIRNEREISMAIQTTTTYNCGRLPQGELGADFNYDYEGEDYCEPLEDTQLGYDCTNDILRAAEAGNTTALAAAIADVDQDIDAMLLGGNALMLAAKNDHQDVARMLLDAGAATGALTSNANSPELDNWSNVMVAAWYGDQEIMSMFLDASLEHLDTPCDDGQTTPLHAAVYNEHCKTAAILIKFGANVDALDGYGLTPLHYAANLGATACAEDLIAAGADVTLADNYAFTALGNAEYYDHSGIVDAINDAIPDSDAQD